MKKSKISLILVLAIILAFVSPLTTFAEKAQESETKTSAEAVQTSKTDDSKTSDEALTEDEAISEEIPETQEPVEEVTGNYYETNPVINFDRMVDGNAFLIGNDITITGKVNGDLFVIGDNINLTKDGQIFGNVYMIAENFKHTGLVYNLYALLTNYTCEYDGMTALDLKVFADNIDFSGYTERNVYFSSDNIKLSDDAYIVGNFVYASTSEPNIGEKTVIYGDTVKEDLFSIATAGINPNSEMTNNIISVLTLLGTVLGILLLVNFFKPNALYTEFNFSFSKVLKALGLGILAFLSISIIVALLFLSTIFTELSAIILTGVALALMVSSTVVILTVATMLYNKFNRGKSKFFAFLYAIVTTLIYFGLTLIPYAGIAIIILTNLIGLGFIVLWLFKIRENNKIKMIAEKNIEETNTVSDTNNNDAIKDEIGKKKIKSELIIAIVAGVIFAGIIIYPIIDVVISSTKNIVENSTPLQEVTTNTAQEGTVDTSETTENTTK